MKVIETVVNQFSEQNEGFFLQMLGPLLASALRNFVTGKGNKLHVKELYEEMKES